MNEIKDSLKRVKDIGYNSVQLSGLGPHEPQELAKLLKDYGLSVAGTHVGFDSLKKDPEKVIREHHMYETRHIVIPSLPAKYYTEEGLRELVNELRPLSKIIRDAGLKLSFHNHNRELVRIGKQTWLDLLYTTMTEEELGAELDTYWIQAGGGDPADWIMRYKSRVWIIHLKDMRVTVDGKQQFAEVGEGNLNWKRIREAINNSTAEFLAVEQDDCYDRNPFESLRISYKNLTEWGYK
jgi:sugar phosphate isomerase/epimerase